MNTHNRKRSLLSLSWPIVLVALVALPSSPLHAHIIPPEGFHPVAESYRRLNFVVNLNPVRWQLVRQDARSIVDHYATVSPQEAQAYAMAVNRAINDFTTAADPTPTDRKTATRRLFELSTRAVARIVVLHLEAAEKALDNYAQASSNLNAARQIALGFEHEIRATDKDGFINMSSAWLELSSALGSPDMIKTSAAPPSRERFRRHAQTILDYMQENFADTFSVGNGWMLPLPRHSSTFNPSAAVPPKLPPGYNINKQIPRPRQILNMSARGVDENETPLIALGDMAFGSPYLFGEPARSLHIACNTCHNKGVTNPQFIIPGLSSRKGGLDVSNSFFAPHGNNGHFGHLDIPDLRGLRYTAPYGHDGRFATLREFVQFAIKHEFNGAEPAPLLMDGMVAYLLEFDFLPNDKLNNDGTLNDKASTQERQGEELFNQPFRQMGGKSCATCHVPSDHFIDRKSHNIGSVKGTGPGSQDQALDTPTLLSAKYSAPYFHDGSLPTLRSVVEWFDGTYKLGLEKGQIDALTAYLDAVGDGQAPYEDTAYYLAAEVKEFYLFLSTYAFLKSQEKLDLMNMTFQTIASELRNHKWELADNTYLPVMERLAELMDEAYVANKEGDRSMVDQKVDQYRKLYEANVEHLK